MTAVSDRSELQSVSFIFMPKHAEVSGNGHADKLASLVPIAGGRTNSADILNVIPEMVGQRI